MNARFRKVSKEIVKWLLVALLLSVSAWLGGYLTARFYTKRMVQDASMLAEVLHNG